MTIETLPLSELRVDKANVRSIGAGADAGLVASILSRGILQPLIVRPNGEGHTIIEGARRFDALSKLAKNKQIDKDYPVPVIIRALTDAEARETSLTTNIMRTAMHPVDEFRAIVALHDNKEQPLDVDQIALRFGTTASKVRQCLALGALDDVILNAWRDDQIKADAAEAFTLCQSKDQQKKLFAKLVKDRNVARWAILRELKTADAGQGALLNLVGKDEYEKRGGKVTEDLFGTNHVLSDLAMLSTMADEVFAVRVEALTAEGWGFVLTSRPDNFWEYGKVEPKPQFTKEEAARMKVVLAEIKKFEEADEYSDDDLEPLETERNQIQAAATARAFTPEQRKKSGVMIALDRDTGRIEATYGIVAPKAQKPTKPDAKTAAGKKASKVPAKISQALEQRLHLQMLDATRSAILQDKQPGKLAQLLASLVAAQIDLNRPYGLPDNVKKALKQLRETVAPKVMLQNQLRTFDGKDYFANCGKAFGLAAIKETNTASAQGLAELAKQNSKGIASYAVANVLKKGWLPKELRGGFYKGK